MLMKKSTPQTGILNVGIEIGDEKKYCLFLMEL